MEQRFSFTRGHGARRTSIVVALLGLAVMLSACVPAPAPPAPPPPPAPVKPAAVKPAVTTTVPPVTTTQPLVSSTSQTLQAESAATNLPSETTWSGYHGAGAVCCWAGQGQYVTFTFKVPSMSADLGLRYSAGNGDASRKLELDGSVIVANQVFAATPDWSTWSVATVTRSLSAGTHTLKVWYDSAAGSANFLNLDELTVNVADPPRVATTSPPLVTTTPPVVTTLPPVVKPAGTAVALNQKLGFFPGYAQVAGLVSLETMLGRQAKYVVQFADGNINNFAGSVWGEVVNAGAFQTIANRVTLVESIPLAFGGFVDASTAGGQATARAGLTATLNGTYDSQYRQAAQMIKDGGFPNAIVRLGWEFDGGWYMWSSRGNCDVFQAAFRHVHDVFTSVSPGFRFDWNATSAYLASQAACAWPGDNYVDIVGLDYYDMGLGVAYNAATRTWADPAGAFNSVIVPNLKIQRDWAIAHGKQVSYPEWALAGLGTGGAAGGDDPAYIQGMYDWMNNLPASGPGSLAYQSYFNSTSDEYDHRITSYPNAKARYIQLFGS